MEKCTNEELNQIEKLRGSDNYQMWKFQVLIHVEASDLKDIVTMDPPDPKTQVWKKKDANAKRIIVMSIEKKIMTQIMNCETAKEIWNKIRAIYERDNEQLKCKLLQEFFAYTYSKDMDISTFISKLENMACTLNALDTKVTKDMLTSKILMALPENYRHFVSAWESSPVEERTLENLTARLLTEELRNNTEKNETVSTAFKATETRCYICN
ncbi:uncharacterized protein LOC114881967 [Osmia bicornis bicornis]|uniref:uncharacterized protein LOC114881967 n=1 Tax=Osmia bicornis bicornis TaxID=1437191 RepID=UPI001EAEFFA4|nr:uncharacterized protein LOC114881967 [Osmia bicornis bicornis]